MSDADHGSPRKIILDGESLTLAELVAIARDPRVGIELSPAAKRRVRRSAALIEEIVGAYRQARRDNTNPVLDYGVTTGFGEFKDKAIDPDDLERLQRNILLSHAVGTGDNSDIDDPANYFPPEVVRAALAIRLNAFLKGNSGVRFELVEAVRRMLVHGIVPRVPIRGSVGSSGDLCPLAHLFVVLLGEGEYFVVGTPYDLVASRPREFRHGLDALAQDLAGGAGREPWLLPGVTFKEGLALSNGATFSAALLALAIHDAEIAADIADVAAALTLEAICGCARAFDPKVHEARGHGGQIVSAANVRALLAGEDGRTKKGAKRSRLVETADEVQDPYSLRCAPAVHGAARDTLAYARRVAEREINAATDNPLFFPGSSSWDETFANNWKHRRKLGNKGRRKRKAEGSYDGSLRRSFSAGNFHGEPVGMAADFLAIALAEFANISERRTQLLLDGHHNRGLPPNLIPEPGVNSGYMIAQYCAAGIVSENKVLCHPASVDSIPTSANSEDHNAMATIAARKLRTVLGNVQAVLAIELMVAAQAVEWRVIEREGVRVKTAGAFEKWADSAAGPKQVASYLGPGTAAAYAAIRATVRPLVRDRRLDDDLRDLRRLVETGALFVAVGKRVPLAGISPLAPNERLR